MAVERRIGNEVDAWLDDRLLQPLGLQPRLDGVDDLAIRQGQFVDVEGVEIGDEDGFHAGP